MPTSDQLSMLGQPLEPCSTDPLTGWFRTGCCETDEHDAGLHVVCVQATAEFLEFSRRRGNDLSTPRAGFVGLRPGDRWCVCAARWREAFDAGVAPPVFLAGTHAAAVDVCGREELLSHAVDSHNLN